MRNTLRHWPRLLLAALTAFALAGCADDPTLSPGGTGGSEPGAGGGQQGAPAPGGGLSVSEALASDAQGPLTVRGFLIERDGEVRLCEAALESFPPQCGGPSVRVEGVSPEELAGAQQHEDVTWVDDASLTGQLGDEVLRVSETSI